MTSEDLDPADFAAVVDVRYDFGEERSGDAHHGLDLDEADELAEILLRGHEYLVDGDQEPSEKVTQTVNSLIVTLQNGRSAALEADSEAGGH